MRFEFGSDICYRCLSETDGLYSQNITLKIMAKCKLRFLPSETSKPSTASRFNTNHPPHPKKSADKMLNCYNRDFEAWSAGKLHIDKPVQDSLKCFTFKGGRWAVKENYCVIPRVLEITSKWLEIFDVNYWNLCPYQIHTKDFPVVLRSKLIFLVSFDRAQTADS